MRVAAVQFKPDREEPAASLRLLVRLAEQAAEVADLVVLPEMALTGYVFEDAAAIDEVAETVEGPTIRALREVAGRAKAWIVVGYPEVAVAKGVAGRDTETAYYNSAAVIDATGACVFNYRKTMLYDEDMAWATPGDSGYAVFDTGLPRGRFTVGICMDLNDDAFIQWCVDSAVDAVAFPTNWVDEGQSPWGYWAWRMSPTRSVLVAANTYGPEAHTGFTGLSAVIAGRTVYAAAPASGDGVILADLDNIPVDPKEATA